MNRMIQVKAEALEKKRNAAQEAILARALPQQFKTDESNYFRGMSLYEITKELFREQGINPNGKTPGEVWNMQRKYSTSDFPILFEGALDKALRADYQSKPEQWDKIARRTTVKDYRPRNFYQIETKNGMCKTPEGGEIKYTTILQSKQTIFIEKYAEGIRFTREAFINDDLDALSVIAKRFARDWDELRGDLVWGMIIDNIKMHDKSDLFSASHKNLITGANSALSEAGLEAAMLAFAQQKALGGERSLHIVPHIIVVPPQLYVKAAKLLTTIAPNNTQNVNVFESMFDIIVENRLINSPDTWYMMADPNAIDCLYYAYLEGGEDLRVHCFNNFENDCFEYAVRGDFGYAAIDYRGIVKMVGE